MKSAYELAMERLNKADPNQKKLTKEQKDALAAIDAKYKARVAEREIFLTQKLVEARVASDYKAIESIEKQLVSERARLEEEREAAKEEIRRQ